MPLEKTHVLLVEDEDNHAELVRRSFEGRDSFQLTVAETLAEAREQQSESPPDLMLIDLVLPDGRGVDLLPGDGEEVSLPIVIMTSHGDQEVAVGAIKAGALHYVVKSPSTLMDMPQIVESTLREWGHIVERRRAESALKASEEHFRSLIENALDIILVVEEDGTIDYASPSIQQILGLDPLALLEANLYEHVHPEDRALVEEEIQRAANEPGTTRYLTYRQAHVDGTLHHLEAVTSTHRLLESRRRVVINSRDVTDRILAEQERERLAEQLRTTQKWEIIGTLAGGIANEFNNMLTPILGFGTLAMDEAEPGSRIHKRLERVLSAANRSRELAQQLMTFSRQEEPQRSRIRLGEAVEKTLKLLRATLPVNIEMQQRSSVDNDHILADADQINQLLVNLSTNAHHAMPDGGVLSIEINAVKDPGELTDFGTTLQNHDVLRLTVRDTGTGMDAETSERAFEPFFTTKAAEQRSGLGLAVSRGIVANHGGVLRVESAPGEGTSIHVYLPAAD